MSMTTFWVPLTALLVTVLAVLVLGNLRQLDRSDPSLRVWRWALVGAGLLTTAAAASIDPAMMPADWVTALQESGSHGHIRQLEGTYGHAGEGFRALSYLFAGNPFWVGIRTVVALNLWLAALCTLMFAGVCLHIFRNGWAALAMAAIFALNRLTVNAALAETAGMVVTLLFLAGTIGMYTQQTEAGRRWGLALVLWSTICTPFFRLESTGYGLVALAFILPDPTGLRARLLERISDIRVAVRLAVAGVVILGLYLFGDYAPRSNTIGHVGWLVDGIARAPLYLSQLPGRLSFGGIPLVFTALAVVGSAHALRNMTAFGGLPISIALLGCIYMSSSHGDWYEMIRKGSMIAPEILVLSCFAWRELALWPRWLAGSSLAVGALASIPFLPLQEAYVLDANQQRAVRDVVALVDAFPECAIVVPVRGWGGNSTGWQMGVILDGRPHFLDPATPESWRRDGADDLDNQECVLLYRGLDCDVVGCDAWGPTEPVVWETTFPSRPYTKHVGDPGDEVRLWAVTLSPWTPPSPPR